MLDNFFKKKAINITKEYEDLDNFADFSSSLLNSKRYIAKSEYLSKIKNYDGTINFFNVLKNSDLLSDYCNKNGLDKKVINNLLELYDNFEGTINKHNDDFIENGLVEYKEYLDNILKDVDPAINLDRNQREVILTDEDYCLVIAGAGAGKTTTVAAKAKYLVEKLNIPENEILIVSFTNKAVDELRERINKDLKLECIISTFHSIGNAILKTNTVEKLNISRENTLYYILLDYFKKSVLTNEALTKKLVLFFSTYFNVPYEGDNLSEYLNGLARTTNTTLKSDLNEFKQEIIDAKSKKKETINNEIVRSYQEAQIANYLYLNNLDYTYEPIYQYNIKYSNKPYTPDFVIKQGDKTVYIEHFGITQNGENNLYSQIELNKYKKAVNDKILLHKKHGTKLIYTFSQYNDGRTLLQHLDEELRKNGLILKRRDDKEVLQKIINTEENKYISKLIVLISRFINLFKTNGYKEEKFDEFKNSTRNVRNQLFLDICKECYLEYERKLKESHAIDFQDMINDSAILLEKMAEQKTKLRFKYVIVDEYQDISRQRFDLVSALRKVCDAKVIAVGDDWQSIYAFSGSDVELFLDFEKKTGYAKMLKIENTYRNSQEIIDIAGNFIQKNQYQIKKTLKSPKHIEDPIIIYTYDPINKKPGSDNKSGKNYNLAAAVENCLDDIAKYNEKEKKNNKNVLILGRYNYEGNNLEISGLFQTTNRKGQIKSIKYPDFDITFMTAHASKGLGFDNVIIINCINGTFGFPSKIQNDPVMKHVLIEDKSYDFAEERRLFYVAMTRTKNRVFCVAPQKFPSEFLVEINKEYEKVVKHGEWEEEVITRNYRKTCPICGYPLQYKYKPAYGLRLNICTNDPEICGFMTNDIKGGKMQIMKCNQCQDGYLIIKQGKDSYILGCTNYKNDGTGCNNIITREKYFEMQSLTPDTPVESKKNVTRTKRPNPIKVVDNTKIIKEYNIRNNRDLNDFYEVSCIILSCVNTVSEKHYFGAKKIVDLLFGIDIKNFEYLNTINEFNSLSKCNRDDIESLVFAMVKDKLLTRTKEQYPVLHPTNEGKIFIESKSKDEVRKLYRAFLKISSNFKNSREQKEEENSN